MLLPWLIEWMQIISTSSHRGLRHTAVEVAMCVMSSLCALKLEVASAREAKERLTMGKKKKKDTMSAAIEEEMARLTERSEYLSTFIGTLFDGIFQHRYRDAHAEIRACCAIAIATCIAKLPETFLSDANLKCARA